LRVVYGLRVIGRFMCVASRCECCASCFFVVCKVMCVVHRFLCNVCRIIASENFEIKQFDSEQSDFALDGYSKKDALKSREFTFKFEGSEIKQEESQLLGYRYCTEDQKNIVSTGDLILICRQLSAVGSSKFLSGPMLVATCVTSSSRMPSSGGLVTWANSCLK